MSILYPQDKNPVFQPGGYGKRYDAKSEAIARAGEPPINYAAGQEHQPVSAFPVLASHPTYGAARGYRDAQTGEFVIEAGPIAVRTRFSPAEAALLWSQLLA